MHRDVLSVPATSTSSERAFSRKINHRPVEVYVFLPKKFVRYWASVVGKNVNFFRSERYSAVRHLFKHLLKS